MTPGSQILTYLIRDNINNVLIKPLGYLWPILLNNLRYQTITEHPYFPSNCHTQRVKKKHCFVPLIVVKCLLFLGPPILILQIISEGIALHRSKVQSSSVKCRVMQCSAVQSSAVQCSAVPCSAMQCGGEQCSAVQCNEVLCSAVQCIDVWLIDVSTVQCSSVQSLK